MQTKQRILIVFLLIVVTALSLKSCFHQQKENAVLKDVVAIKEDSTSYWKDKFNTEHAEKLSADASLSTIQAIYGQLLDSITSRLDAKASDVQAVTAANTVASGTIIPKVDTVSYPDSTKDYRFRYNDRWLDLDGVIGKQSQINYRLTDSIIFTSYRKKTGFLRKQTYIDGYSLNPNARVTGITGIRVSNTRDHRFGAGPYIGFGWNGSKWSPSAGISVHYSLIKF